MSEISTLGRRGHGLAVDPRSPLLLVEHTADILGEAHGFGGFLFDRHGRLVRKDGLAWLYTTRICEGKWDSWVRSFNLSTLQAGVARRVLVPQTGYDRAVLHHVVAIADDLVVGLYCDGLGVGAAVAIAPDDDFLPDPGFALRPEVGWETREGSIEGWSLESNGAYVLCDDDEDETVFWQGYDSYLKSGTLGDLGWVKVRVDKHTRKVGLFGRHPANPLAFRDSQWLCTRCGGNLASDIVIDGRHAFFYYLRPSASEIFIGLALSKDPFFLSSVEHFIIDTVLEQEKVVEKFQAVLCDGEIVVFYESKFADGSWHTGLRRYKMNW